MTRRYYALGRTASEAVAYQEKAASDFVESLGVSPDQLANAKAKVKLLGNDRAPSEQTLGSPTHLRDGMTAHARIRGEGVLLGESHTNAHGERITEGYIKNGPHLEKVRIRESEAGPRSRIISEIFGGR
jgi:hypothetical protein